MSDALGWARLGVALIGLLANVAITFWFFSWLMGAAGKAMGVLDNPVLNRHPATARIMLRRVFCSHVNVMRGRDPHGRSYTACARCAKDVNAGKEKWEWR